MTPRFHDVRRVMSTQSTNADVLELARNGEAEGIVVVAEVQTAGRGRHGRTWVAPSGSGLLCSVLLRPPGAVVELVTATMAVAAWDALSALEVPEVELKWPNDLIAASSGRKIAGILAESDWGVAADGSREPSSSERVMIAAGIGINVAAIDDVPVEIADRRISLEELTNRSVDVDDVLGAFLEALATRYGELLSDATRIKDLWQSRLATIGRDVRVDLGSRDIEGRAETVDDRGRLVVRTSGGDVEVVSAGDVVHLGRGS